MADLFRGQPRITIDDEPFELGQIFSPAANRLDHAVPSLRLDLQYRDFELPWLGDIPAPCRIVSS